MRLLTKKLHMKHVIFITCFMFLVAGLQAQRISIAEMKKLMKEAKDQDSLPCKIFVRGVKDTIWGKKLDWEWNKKTKTGEWHMDDRAFVEDSVFFFQDERGYHRVLYYRTTAKSKHVERVARIY